MNRPEIRGGILIVLVLLGTTATVSGRTDTAQTNSLDPDPVVTVATEWFNMSLRLVERTPGFTPPVASRAFAYLGVGLYEAVVPGYRDHRSLAGHLNGLDPLPQPEAYEEFHWPTVANTTLAELSRKLFRGSPPEMLAAVDELEAALVREHVSGVGDRIVERSKRQGLDVARAIYEWSRADGGHDGHARNFTAEYVPPGGTGAWIPTPPDFLPALQPEWGKNRPFLLRAADECRVDSPPTYSEDPASAFYAEAYEVYEAVRSLTEEQREIALFWADDPGATSTPPGHWISILSQVIANERLAADVAVEAYAKMGIALADAFIVCWYEKYQYNLIRPISYIQALIDSSWNRSEVTDPVVTPPFPEFPSGHSVQSGAAAAVLTALLGDVPFTDRTHAARGLSPRSYASFEEAAQEAAISRLYGGIHYRSAIESGLSHGRCIGEKVNALPLKQHHDSSNHQTRRTP